MNKEMLRLLSKSAFAETYERVVGKKFDGDDDDNDAKEKAIDEIITKSSKILVDKKELQAAINEAVKDSNADIKADVEEMKKHFKSDKRGIEFDGEGDDVRVKVFYQKYAPGKVSKKAVEKTGQFLKKFILEGVAQKDLSEGTDADGGYMVHPEFAREVMRIAGEYGVMRNLVRVLPMNTDTKNVTALSGGVTAYMVGEATAITASSPTFGQVVLTAKKMAAITIASNELIEDNSTDQEVFSLVAELIGEAFAQMEDTQIVTGSGSGANINGFQTSSNSDLTDVVMDSGDTTYADVTLDYLLDVMDAVAASVARRGVWIMHRTVLSLIRKLKDTNGDYIFRGLVAREDIMIAEATGLSGYLWGRPVYVVDDMPDTSDSPQTSIRFIAFGDFKKGYILGDRRGITFKRLEEATVGSVNLGEEDQQAIRATKRIAGNVVLGSAIAFLKTAAS